MMALVVKETDKASPVFPIGEQLFNAMVKAEYLGQVADTEANLKLLQEETRQVQVRVGIKAQRPINTGLYKEQFANQ